MTYDQLVAFLAVASAGAFTRASLDLHKSQPAISKLIRNLEDELGLTLFDRSAYRATLTEAGLRLRQRAAELIQQTEALKSFARALAGLNEPILRVAVEAVTPLSPVLDALRAIEARFPAVRIELSTERLVGAADALRKERVDLAIATRIGADADRLEAFPYRRVGVLPVVRRDHPLARLRGAIPSIRLRAYPQIVLRDSGDAGDGPSLNVLPGAPHWTVTDVLAKKQIILAGMGWGGLPDHVVADELASGELVALDVPDFETDEMALFLLRRSDRARGPVAQALWEELIGSAQRIARAHSTATPSASAARKTRGKTRQRSRADAASGRTRRKRTTAS